MTLTKSNRNLVLIDLKFNEEIHKRQYLEKGTSAVRNPDAKQRQQMVFIRKLCAIKKLTLDSRGTVKV